MIGCEETKPHNKPALGCCYCGSKDIIERPAKMRNNQVEITVHCTACGKDWLEYYKFDRIEYID